MNINSKVDVSEVYVFAEVVLTHVDLYGARPWYCFCKKNCDFSLGGFLSTHLVSYV